MKNENFGPSEVYVAFLDILGFGNAVSGNQPEVIEELFAMLQILSGDTREYLDGLKGEILPTLRKLHFTDEDLDEFERSEVDVYSVSDSLYLWTSNNSSLNLLLLVHYVSRLLAYLMLMGYPARAAISYGQVTVRTLEVGLQKQRNIFGNGLVKAYKLEQIQEWSGAIIDSEAFEAASLFKSYGDVFINNLYQGRFITNYEVPLKKGKVKELPTINWAIHFDPKEFGKDATEILSKFARHKKEVNDWSVRNKVNNTIKYFLDMKKKRKKVVTS